MRIFNLFLIIIQNKYKLGAAGLPEKAPSAGDNSLW